MMKLINRLLIIAVIAFGAWFIIQHWDSVDTPIENKDTNTEEIILEEGEGEELVIEMDIDSPLSFDEQLEALEEQAITESITRKPIRKYVASTPTQDSNQAEKFIFNENSAVTVYLFDGGIDLSTFSIPKGHVTFTVRNDGRVSHDFSVEDVKDFGRITPGTIHTFELDLSEGEYVISSPREIDQLLDMRETLRVGNTQ